MWPSASTAPSSTTAWVSWIGLRAASATVIGHDVRFGQVTDLEPFPDGWEKATVVVAHPDDIEWGVASAVAAWTAAGRTVSYVLVTSGEAGIDSMDPEAAAAARQEEERTSGAIVGVTEIEFLGHPDGRIVEGLDLRRDLAAAIRRHRPDVVVAQNHAERWGSAPGAGWNSADHRAVGRATLDAVSDAGNRWIFPELTEAPWAGVQWIAIPTRRRRRTPSTSPTRWTRVWPR